MGWKEARTVVLWTSRGKHSMHRGGMEESKKEHTNG